MAQNIVGGLFGITPNDVYDTYAAQDRQAATALMNNPTLAQMGIYYGSQIGSGLGRGVASLLGVEDPRLQQAKKIEMAKQQGFDTSTTEGLGQLASWFVQQGEPGLAQEAVAMKNKMLESQATVYAKTKEKLGNPKTQAQQVRLDELKAQYGDVEGSRMFNEELYQQEHGLALAAAGVPESGMVKPSDLSTLQGIVSKYTEKPYEKLQAIQEVKGSFKLASEGNTAAVPQLMRALVRIGGNDPQIAAREVAGIAGNPGAVGKIAEAVNAFWTGTPSAEQIKLIGQVLSSSEKIVANQYMQGRQQAETVLGEAKISQQTLKSLLPPVYNIAQPKPKQQYQNAPAVGTVVDGYKFKGGNPADPNNWSK